MKKGNKTNKTKSKFKSYIGLQTYNIMFVIKCHHEKTALILRDGILIKNINKLN